MRFRLVIIAAFKESVIPINYQYPLSAAIYKIIERADSMYAQFLHNTGYRQSGSLKSFKLFTFSDIKVPFSINGDRLCLHSPKVEVQVCFHLPQAAENFIRGIFIKQQLDIADKKSKVRFEIQSVESLQDPLQVYKPKELISIILKPLSPVVAGLPDEKGNYVFLEPGDTRFTESLVYNWRSKISACYDAVTGDGALLMMEVVAIKEPFKSRLIWIKADTPAMTKIRGWLNFELKVTAERRFVELLMNSGVGVYNSMGCGCMEVVP
ncbi:CRISPR-associated endoribonuclease Cas6 [Terrimonas sp.]|uniref:CRISPR-associated endoribonuclease Cas6 n=1 Tax=Terrimonas sp. TaxID=1914338 RepID=UPI000D50B489|nr:CRISPR-associated endoribonuclease Cas6 [Terrimonas sp.]PVD52169.1 CRISPR-associated endoribonuclease Cas6 [Terrimonas sp.]